LPVRDWFRGRSDQDFADSFSEAAGNARQGEAIASLSMIGCRAARAVVMATGVNS